MSEPARLDPREARPLTSREISKVICAIIGGCIAEDPRIRVRVPVVLRLVKLTPGQLVAERANPDGANYEGSAGGHPSWEVALLATVCGFRGWCDPADVATALEWVDQNLPLILGKMAEKTNLPS